MTNIPGLKSGDTIAIVSPAKSIDFAYIEFAKKFLMKRGFKVLVGENAAGKHNYFAGTIQERLEDFQWALNDSNVSLILCSRGGYGSVQLIDKLDWAQFKCSPKWVVGFSDITYFHQKISSFGIQSIHGTMPLNFENNTGESFETLFAAVNNEPYEIGSSGSPHNRLGSAKAPLIGGNLSILYSLIGTNDQANYSGSILFIEDLGEHLYHIDRMLYSFKKRGLLDDIRGLVVGGMTNLKDTETPYGKGYQEIILSHFNDLNIPIAFGFPSGHINDNRSLKLGAEVRLDVNELGAILTFE